MHQVNLTPLPTGTTEGLPCSLVDVLGQWVGAMHRKGLKERTRKDYEILVSRLLKLVVMEYPLFTSISMLEMTHIDYIEDQLHAREVRGSMKKRTRQSYISAIRMFLKWCYRREHTSKDFHSMIEPIRVPKALPQDVYSEQEVVELIENTGGDTPQRKRDQMMVKIAYMLGLRSSSIRYASIDDINWNKKELIVAKAKGNKAGESLPLHDVILDELKDYIKNIRPLLIGTRFKGHNRKHSYEDAPPSDKILFPTSSGLPISFSNFLKVVKRAGKQAGIRNPKVHSIRHSTATHMVMRGGDILDVNALLQHSDLATTMMYLHLDKTRIIGAMHKYHPLLNGALYDLRNGNGQVSANPWEKGFPRHPSTDQNPTRKHHGTAGDSDVRTLRNPIKDAISGFHNELERKRNDNHTSHKGTIPLAGLVGKGGRTQTEPITRRGDTKNRASMQGTSKNDRCAGTHKQRGGNTVADP